jgi:hypothetical protein
VLSSRTVFERERSMSQSKGRNLTMAEVLSRPHPPYPDHGAIGPLIEREAILVHEIGLPRIVLDDARKALIRNVIGTSPAMDALGITNPNDDEWN